MVTKKQEDSVQMSPAEKIVFHNGALQTLVGERNELYKMIQMVENLMKAHISELEKLGVNLNSSNSKKA